MAQIVTALIDIIETEWGDAEVVLLHRSFDVIFDPSNERFWRYRYSCVEIIVQIILKLLHDFILGFKGFARDECTAEADCVGLGVLECLDERSKRLDKRMRRNVVAENVLWLNYALLEEIYFWIQQQLMDKREL